MYTELSQRELISGDTLTTARIEGPDREWTEQLKPFLSHKGAPWTSQIRETLETSTAPLESRYYVGIVDGRVVGNVSTFTCRGVGILGHVFTHPDFRRRGISKAIIEAQMADFASGGEALILSTGLEGHARRMYEGFGYRSIALESHEMALYRESEAEFYAWFFRAGESVTRGLDWGDWALLTALMVQPEGSNLRLVAFSVYGRATMEATFLAMRNRRDSDFAVLQGVEGSAVGIVSLVPDMRFPGVRILDLFVHPHYEGDEEKLISSIRLDSIDGKILSYALTSDSAKIAILEANGFSIEARLETQIALSPVDPERLSPLLILSR